MTRWPGIPRGPTSWSRSICGAIPIVTSTLGGCGWARSDHRGSPLGELSGSGWHADRARPLLQDARTPGSAVGEPADGVGVGEGVDGRFGDAGLAEAGEQGLGEVGVADAVVAAELGGAG